MLKKRNLIFICLLILGVFLITGCWLISTPTYTVTFDSQGGSAVDPQTVERGGLVTEPTAPTKAGYTFAGWYEELECTNAWDFDTDTVTSDVTLYAKWATNTYTVTFDKNGGDTEANPKTKTATHGGNVGTLPTEPTKTGYTFTSWNTETDGSGTKFKATTAVIADITVYAQWTINSYTVTYEGNDSTGGTVPSDANNYEQGDIVTVLGNTGNLVKTQDGISLLFTGWNTAADGSETSYNAADTFNMGTANVTLYAEWSAIRATGPAEGLIFYDKGSISDGWRYLEAAPSDQSGPYYAWSNIIDVEIGISAQGTDIGKGQANTTAIITQEGHTASAAQLCDILTEGSYDDWFLPSEDELNLMYTNLYNEGVGGFANDSYWSSSEVNELIARFQYFWPGTTPGNYRKSNSAVRVRAVRAFRSTEPTYIVNYNANEADGGTVPSDGYHYEPGETVTVLGNTGSLVKTDHDFAGWNTMADGSGTTYIADQTFTMGGANITLFAKWTPDYALRDTGPAGGLIFYDKGSYSDGWRYLEAAPNDQSASAEWGCYQTLIDGADSTAVGTGEQNTIDIEAACPTAGIAADICADLSLVGYSDWFLPSKDELNLMYTNLHNIVPPVGGFADGWDYYWSSSEYSADSAWVQNFSSGNPARGSKNGGHWVRAVRAF